MCGRVTKHEFRWPATPINLARNFFREFKANLTEGTNLQCEWIYFFSHCKESIQQQACLSVAPWAMVTWRTTTRNLNPKSLQISIKGHKCIHKNLHSSTGSATLHSFWREWLTLQWQKRKTSFDSSAATNWSNAQSSSSEVVLLPPSRKDEFVLGDLLEIQLRMNSTQLLCVVQNRFNCPLTPMGTSTDRANNLSSSKVFFPKWH